MICEIEPRSAGKANIQRVAAISLIITAAILGGNIISTNFFQINGCSICGNFILLYVITLLEVTKRNI